MIAALGRSVNAADLLDGLTATQAADLSKLNIPVLLPARVPQNFRIYAVKTYPGEPYYQVLYSDGVSSLIVQTENGEMSDHDKRSFAERFKVTGSKLPSALFGSYRILQNIDAPGCYTHDPPTFHHEKIWYSFFACGSLAADQLADIIASTRRISSFHASSMPRGEDDKLLSSFSNTQKHALQTLNMPVALFSYLPESFRVVKMSASETGGKGSGGYDIVFGDGYGTIEIKASDSGFGEGDVPMRRLNVPVHSKLFGETALVAKKGDDPAWCLTHEAAWLSISGKPGYSITGCHVPPYDLKRVIESARLIHPL